MKLHSHIPLMFRKVVEEEEIPAVEAVVAVAINIKLVPVVVEL